MIATKRNIYPCLQEKDAQLDLLEQQETMNGGAELDKGWKFIIEIGPEGYGCIGKNYVIGRGCEDCEWGYKVM